MRTKEVEKELPVKLTEEEKKAYSEELAKSHEEQEAIEAEKKTTAKQYTDTLTVISERQKKLSKAIVTGEEVRTVLCELHREWDSGLIQVVRTDTKEVIDTYPIPDDEMQEHIDFKGEQE